MNRKQVSLSVDTLDLLKEKILKSAIEGKLVPQIEEESEAPQIGKIPEEVPFEIPKKWKWIYLGRVGSWKSGLTPSRSNPMYYENGNVNWLKTGDLNDGAITKTSEKITTAAVSEGRLRINPIGSVLMAMYGATIGKLGILAVPSTTNQACCACIPENFVNNKYLFYFLLARRQQFISMGAGGAQPNISRNKIVNSSFPLPPLEEQRRIVERLDTLFSEIDAIQKSIDEVSRLSESFEKQLLQSAISGKLVPQLDEESEAKQIGQAPEETPFDIPCKWKWIRLNSLTDYIQRGKSPKYSEVKKIPVVSQKCNQWSGFEIDKARFIDPDTISKYSEERKLQDLDLLWNSTGTGTIGRVAVYESKLNPFDTAVADSHVTVVRVDKELMLPKFLYWFLRSPFVQRSIESLADGSTNQKELATRTIKNVLVPVPPLEEQKRIVEKLDKLMLEIKKLK